MPVPPSVNRNETNIGHGGPGLGRQFETIFHRFPCAIAVLSVCALSLAASPAVAQGSVQSDVERIERLRDQAGGVAEADGVEQATAEQAASTIEAQVEDQVSPNESLPLGAGQGDLFGGDADPAASGSMGDGWLLSTLAALGVVLAIVFGIRWLLRRGGVVSTAAPQGGVVEVLSRTTVAPRSHVVLMRVGTRILIVSDSPSGMRTLDTVQDAEQVAELLGAIDSAKPASMSQNFGSVMKKLSGQWSGDASEVEPVPLTPGESHSDEDRASGAISSLRGRLAALSDVGGRA